MEADFNAILLDTVRDHVMLIKTQNRMADDGILAKTLFYDVTWQARIPVVLQLLR